MTTRQVMVAAKESCETLWMRARGNEQGIIIRGLREGECVLLDFTVDRQLQVPIPMEANGRFPFPTCTMFRLRKQVLPGNNNSDVNVYRHGETYVEIEGA